MFSVSISNNITIALINYVSTNYIIKRNFQPSTISYMNGSNCK